MFYTNQNIAKWNQFLAHVNFLMPKSEIAAFTAS